ncbi:lytic transglycosylase domain-containing protein [Niabella sp.]|uniref:lytic transglycosylase domain-containing protein n=1 Tax=Niabella sp. TaxID=1962976 RepID=UPI00260FA913|nr:lytic transglycosylase domain-containing protein [Niabella sp.]
MNVYKKYWLIGTFLAFLSTRGNAQHVVSFCGEPVPMDQQFIQDKLINTIRKQVNVVNFPALRRRAFAYFPLVERYLAAYGLHRDLKYLPIVESGFLTEEESAVGAKGIWQIMPATARSYGLVIDETRDERENFDKATRLACTLIKDNYNMLIRYVGSTNWPLTIAAYNFGIGNIVKAVKAQGYNYFTMKLNPETALYVYKIIAVKELFEYPELYNSKFGYNIFNPKSGPKNMPAPRDLKVVNDPDVLQDIEKEVAKNANKKEAVVKEEYVMAHVLGRIRNFQDGDIVDVVLDEDLQTARKGLSYKGYKFGVQGWIIDDRVYFKLGYDHDVTLLDTNKEKGILLTDLLSSKRIDVLLKNLVYEK